MDIIFKFCFIFISFIYIITKLFRFSDGTFCRQNYSRTTVKAVFLFAQLYTHRFRNGYGRISARSQHAGGFSTDNHGRQRSFADLIGRFEEYIAGIQVGEQQTVGITGDRECLERARRAYELIWQLNNGLIKDPTGLGPKTIPETRTGRALADPMIYLNITAVMRRCDSEQRELYDARAKECAEAIFKYHRKPEMHCTLESVDMDGNPELWYTAGRVVNPGHDIECSWFVMEEANYEHNPALHQQAVEMFDDAFNAGWDKEYGGLLYFIDCLGKPPEAALLHRLPGQAPGGL